MEQYQAMKVLVSALSSPTYVSKPISSHLSRSTVHCDRIHDNVSKRYLVTQN